MAIFPHLKDHSDCSGKMGSGQATVLGSHVARPGSLLPFAPRCPHHPSLLALA